MKTKKGFSMVELLIGIGILAILVVAFTSIFNPISQVNKGKDARKKKDITRIKVAFEEYNNDKGCYPTWAEWGDRMMDKTNCNGNLFTPWLPSWPCDPTGTPYMFAFDDSSCPKWYKIFAYLENENDTDIPNDWREARDVFTVGSAATTYSGNQVNFGVSSSNIDWREFVLPESCGWIGNCYRRDLSGACENARPAPGDTFTACSGTNCYADNNCSAQCRISFCDSRSW